MMELITNILSGGVAEVDREAQGTGVLNNQMNKEKIGEVLKFESIYYRQSKLHNPNLHCTVLRKSIMLDSLRNPQHSLNHLRQKTTFVPFLMERNSQGKLITEETPLGREKSSSVFRLKSHSKQETKEARREPRKEPRRERPQVKKLNEFLNQHVGLESQGESA